MVRGKSLWDIHNILSSAVLFSVVFFFFNSLSNEFVLVGFFLWDRGIKLCVCGEEGEYFLQQLFPFAVCDQYLL